ncbi:aminotransferase class I/II-fold pyridoxal phosphate-dependent enzyme [Microbacterium sp. cf332]|uniref:aminotransferase class I/II-fold pyridoxal phosphate-dependent enzyme n=1 Tax=Microbacterium sp. cf332 TaxID=1761804 RepID=UPI000888F00A|nr:aminotransferase class I/II-fold pyridoxal phosphate-dependent enzyme [Microbacterium sp. cf332]SDQ15307.1 DNA-binding transcriptional regulator, MocR family, contains an aminotransferase domain [Microbacterium sp. cf332]
MTLPDTITGHTAGDIADSVRMLLERGALRADDALPPVRALAESLGVNRNTVVAAYRLLAQAGVVVARGRGGTRIAEVSTVASEGVAADTVLRDIGSGNPDPALIPDPSAVLARVAGRPVLYGEPVIDRGLADWAEQWFAADDPTGDVVNLTITGGAVDAVERLLAQALTRDDAVALEDPCFLASIHTVRLAGYRALPVPVDDEGMTVAGLRAALDAGARAVVITPRAQNPTGSSLSDGRAAALRDVLADHPYVLVIEDDHFSLLSTQPYRSVIGERHERWARVRSVSKFLGPDMCLAVTASDPVTAERLALRLGSGTTWVSHLLQRLAHALVTDETAAGTVATAREHYAARNAAFAAALSRAGLPCSAGDGLSLWVEVPGTARVVADALMRRGWLARTGDEFRLADHAASRHLRLTVHDLDDDDTALLVRDLVAAALPSRKA